MRRGRNVQDLALPLGLQHALIHARAVVRAIALPGAVELIYIDMVGFEQAQGGIQIAAEALGRGRARLGGQGIFLAAMRDGAANLLLAVAVSAGSVNQVHAAVQRAIEQLARLLKAHALNGQRAEAVLLRSNACAAQGNVLHNKPSKSFCNQGANARLSEQIRRRRPFSFLSGGGMRKIAVSTYMIKTIQYRAPVFQLEKRPRYRLDMGWLRHYNKCCLI